MDTAVLSQSVSRLTHDHGQQLVEIAAMLYACRLAVRCAATRRGVSGEGILKTLDACVESHLIDCDIHPIQLRHVITELEQDLTTTHSHN